MKMVSVLMSVYNENEREVVQCITSLVEQTYKNIEIIIVIDNPQKKEFYKRIIHQFKDDRIIILVNEENIGLARSMNKAAEAATGRYLMRMDADDVSELNRIDLEVGYLKKNRDVKLVCTDFVYMDENGEIIRTSNYEGLNDRSIVESLPWKNCIHHPTVMMDKKAFVSLGGYRDFPCAQDYDLWLRFLTSKYKIHYLNSVMLRYRVRRNGITSKNKIRQLFTAWYIQKLFFERMKKGRDSYSKKNLFDYYEAKGLDENLNDDYWLHLDAVAQLVSSFKKSISVIVLLKLLYCLARSKAFRMIYSHIIMNKIKLLYYKYSPRILWF